MWVTHVAIKLTHLRHTRYFAALERMAGHRHSAGARAPDSSVGVPDEINVIGCGPMLLHTSHKVFCGATPAGHLSLYKTQGCLND
jgi:hypothetical protein